MYVYMYVSICLSLCMYVLCMYTVCCTLYVCNICMNVCMYVCIMYVCMNTAQDLKFMYVCIQCVVHACISVCFSLISHSVLPRNGVGFFIRCNTDMAKA